MYYKKKEAGVITEITTPTRSQLHVAFDAIGYNNNIKSKSRGVRRKLEHAPKCDYRMLVNSP